MDINITMDIIASLKQDDFAAAMAKSIPVKTAKDEIIGKLVPVGSWILKDDSYVKSICDWRQKVMRMFLIQFASTLKKTRKYLRELSISSKNRIFFLVFDCDNNFIGHIGISGIDDANGELDNVMRGVQGGHLQLMHYAEACLLDWCFEKLELREVTARVLSYNWMAIELHEGIGFKTHKKIPLYKYKKDDMVFHDFIDLQSTNVNYSCTWMKLLKKDFRNIMNKHKKTVELL